MTAEESQRLVQGYLEAFNEGDWARCSQSVAPDVIQRERTIDWQVEGVDGLMRRLQEIRAAAPDLRVEVNSWVIADDGSTIATEVTWTRDEGEGDGALSGMTFFSIEAGRIRAIDELHAPLPQRLACRICIHPPDGFGRPLPMS